MIFDERISRTPESGKLYHQEIEGNVENFLCDIWRAFERPKH
jgi:hypothetical protein